MNHHQCRSRPPIRQGASTSYGGLNAGKRSICLDLASAGGRRIALWEPLAVGDAGGIERAISREGAALAGRLLPESLVERWCQAAADPGHWLRTAQADQPQFQMLTRMLSQGDVVRLAQATGRPDLLRLFNRPGWSDHVEGGADRFVAWTRPEVIGITTPMWMTLDDAMGLESPRAWIAPAETIFDNGSTTLSLAADGEFGLLLTMAHRGAEMRLRWMEPGEFLMGRQADTSKPQGPLAWPQHSVAIGRGFWIADSPCTSGFYGRLPTSALMLGAETPEPNRPMVGLNWLTVNDFLTRLVDILPVGWTASLPTEAEWEYACRAGSSGRYWWGDRPAADLAPFGLQARQPRPVRAFPPNPWGLHDLPGAVREWCLDDARMYEDLRGLSVVDPVGPTESDHAVIRGGLERAFGSSDRDVHLKSDSADNLGFRICLRFRAERS
ncbi:MAG: SUMF1/EgtB/PvdO family nonheme iron enzyme [Burkholderiales bacterium]|nr:SUMF1/EgtB/PvdO family nonheme iron enzyme [Burkholderiales bacterium]